jgi:uncharacterized membrane protein YphA (DoxX/SURF4 family)
MTKSPWKGALLLLFRICLGLLFIISGLSKLLNLSHFTLIVRNFNILPFTMVPVFSILLPPLEYLLGVALVLGFYPRLGALAAAGLLIMFIIAIVINLARGHLPECGCFEFIIKSRVGAGLLINDILLLIGTVVLMRTKIHALCLNDYLKLQKIKKSTGAEYAK